MSTDLRPPRYKVKLRLQNDILPRAEELPQEDYFFIGLVFDKCIKNYVYSAQHGWQFYDTLHDEINYVSVHVKPALLLQEDLARVNLASMFQRVNIPWRDDLVQEIGKIHRFLVSTERDFIRKELQGPKHMPIAIEIKMEIYRAIILEEDELTAQISSLAMDDYEIKTMPASKESIETLEKVEIDKGLDAGDTCTICYEEILVGLEGIRMPCTHLYHRDCILQWLSRSFVCPLCRFEMPIAPSEDSF